MTQFMQIFR